MINKKEEKIIEEQAARQATVPPPAFIKPVLDQSSKEPPLSPGEDRDRIMAEFVETEAWKLIKNYIEGKAVMLAQQLRESVPGSSLEEVGFRFMITDQVNKFGRELINFVEMPAKVLKAKKEHGELTRKQR